MDSKSLNQAISTYHTDDNVNAENYRKINQIEQLSDIAIDQNKSSRSKLTALKIHLKTLLIEELNINAKGGGALSTWNDRQRLEALNTEIPDLCEQIQALDLKLTTVSLDDILAVIQKDLPDLKASTDSFTSIEHEYLLEDLKMALSIRQEMNTGIKFSTAFANKCRDTDKTELFRKLTA